jgi:hypothetical protein
MLKERNLQSPQPLTRLPINKLVPQDLFSYVKVKIALPKEEPVLPAGGLAGNKQFAREVDAEMHSEHDLPKKGLQHDSQQMKEKKRKHRA